MKRRDFVKLCSSSLALGAAGVPGLSRAQEKMVWKASDVHPLGYPTVEAVQRMGKKLETQTNGRISIQMYPLMQLGGEKEMIEQAQVGALQIARISVGAMGPVVDDLNVFNLPFIFRDEAHMRKVIDGPIGVELLERVSNSPQSRLIVLGWMDAGTRNVYSNKPVTKPADLKGMKIRMMGNPIFVETMNAMGGNGISMGFNELYGALQTGVVDGAENNPPTLLAQNHYTVSKVYSLTGHLIIPEIFVFSKRTWDTLSKEDQALLKKLSREAQLEQRVLWDAVCGRGRGQAQGGRRPVRPGRQGGVLQGDPAGARQVRRQVRRAAEANRRHQVAVPAHRHAAGRPARVPLFCPGGVDEREASLPAGDGMAVHRLHRDFRLRAGGDHADHPARRVHALRDEQPAVLARAGRGHHDGDVLVPRRRRRLPRQRAHRRRGAAQRGESTRAARHAVGSGPVHGGDRPVHAGLRHPAVPGHPVLDDGRISGAVAGHRLPADSRSPAS